MGNFTSIPITKNAIDSSVYSPRAVIAVFHFKNNQVKTLFPVDSSNKVSDDFVDTLPIILLSDDILNLTVNSDKKGCTHSLSTLLSPGTFNYLGLISPGDWVMAWIVNSKDKRDALVRRLKTNKPTQSNQFNSGLKFIGQCHTIQEQFKVSNNGTKTVRYSLNAIGFGQYQSQIVYSPYLNPGEGTNKNNFMFANNFFKNLTGQHGIYEEQVKNDFSIHDQIIRLHQIFLGPGPGPDIKDQDILRTVQNGFAVPAGVGRLLGLGTDSDDKADTKLAFADITTALVGIQVFNPSQATQNSTDGSYDIGPDFEIKDGHKEFGTYWEPKSDSYRLTGKKELGITPTIGGSIWNILQNHSNPVLNEMYVCLRPEPGTGNILPTFVIRQIPFSTKDNENIATTQFRDLPRFVIDYDIVMGYDFCKSEALRTNTIFLTTESVMDQGNKVHQDQLNISAGPWKYDINDVTKNGIRIYNAKISDDTFSYEENNLDLLQTYNNVLSDFLENSHLKYSGNLQTIGIEDPIAVGENTQLGDVVLHIESLTHTYSVGSNGVTSFFTSMSLSNGIHDTDQGTLDNFDALPAQDTVNDNFAKIKGGYTKELVTQDPPSDDPKPKIKSQGIT